LPNRVEVEAEDQQIDSEHDSDEVAQQKVESADVERRIREHQPLDHRQVDGVDHEEGEVEECHCHEVDDYSVGAAVGRADIVFQEGREQVEADENHETGPVDARLVRRESSWFCVPDEYTEREENREESDGHPGEAIEHALEPNSRGLCHGFLRAVRLLLTLRGAAWVLLRRLLLATASAARSGAGDGT